MRSRFCRCLMVGWSMSLISLTAGPVSAQKLSSELIREDPAKLVLDSRERGDIVRGAILFHQGNIACAKCHQSSKDSDRIGPDLSRPGAHVTDELIVESILQPSKAVPVEYRTATIVGVDGRVYNGVIVKRTDDVILFRDSGNIDTVRTIATADVDEVVVGTTSIMPDGIVDSLKGRQQFLDLLRYVMDVKRRGPQQQSAARLAPRRQLDQKLSGLLLLRKHNCVACHATNGDMNGLFSHFAPDLRWSAKHVAPAYLKQFIADPESCSPHTTMPKMMGHLVDQDRQEAASAIVDFLVSLNGNDFEPSDARTFGTAAVDSGNDLFHTVGCVACHPVRDSAKKGSSQGVTRPLGELHQKYSLPALVAFLEDPHASRPNGRMPNMQLKHREAIDIAKFLLKPSGTIRSRGAEDRNPRSDQIRKGMSLFASMQCFRCHHDIIGTQSDSASIALADLRLQQGCLSATTTGQWPRFTLTEVETDQIRLAIEQQSERLTAAQEVDFHLAHFNCTACHQRNELGGVPADRKVHFQTTNLNLGEQGRIPPTLTGVGAKLKAAWMRDVLVNAKSIRPYMKTRMPQYGERNVGHLVGLFQEVDQRQPTKFAEVEDQKATRELGLKLAGNQGLNCVACHTFQYRISDTMPAVDLTEMAQRLHKDWFYQYMLSPQSFSPNTVMPSFWPNGHAIRTDLAGQPEDQIEALWTYLLSGRQARSPRGVIREPLEIVVTDEARMLRRSYPDIGKRGIGVGYPGGVNLSFDAEQLRLASVWKGKFVDPAGVWYGQGHGRVRPMGRAVSLAKGPELDSLSTPWTVDQGRPPGHRFRGYTLDKSRQPAFEYIAEGVSVQDDFAPLRTSSSTAVQLRRTVTMKPGKEQKPLRFRLATGSTARIVNDGKEVSTDRLRILIVSEHQASESIQSGERMIIVPLEFERSGVERLTLDYSWE